MIKNISSLRRVYFSTQPSIFPRYVSFATKADGGVLNEKTGSGLEVGELYGAKFKVEPLRRSGEDTNTLRARLLCTSLGGLNWDRILIY